VLSVSDSTDATYAYNGNRLKKISDVTYDKYSWVCYSLFDDYSTDPNAQYTYNANGAMTSDPYKGVQYSYDVLGMPLKTDITAINGSVRYVYSAAGEKLTVRHRWNPGLSLDPVESSQGIFVSNIYHNLVRSYVGNKVYEAFREEGLLGGGFNYSLKRILLPNGYVDDCGIYYFYLRDHLGSNCVTAKADGTVMQGLQYYPYGKVNEDEGTGVSFQPYKYGGKEFEGMHGLNSHDFLARTLNDYGRFDRMDPLAEKRPWESPYLYCGGNPINNIDPDGREKINVIHHNPKSKDYRAVEARRQSDNGMIHIYSHGSVKGFSYATKNGEKEKIRNAAAMKTFLENNSETWRTRKRGEKIYIALHACQTGRGLYNGEEYDAETSFAADISYELQDVIVIAPSNKLVITVDGEDIMENGEWNFFKGGKKIGSRPGDKSHNPDMIRYSRPNMQTNENENGDDKQATWDKIMRLLNDALQAGAKYIQQ
jgi:RHS repeat-associated protein